MTDIDDPDDYEAIQLRSQAAFDEMLIDPESWERRRERDLAKSYNSDLGMPHGTSRYRHDSGLFELTSPATCTACGSPLPVGLEVVRRQHEGRWRIQHAGQSACDRVRSADSGRPPAPTWETPSARRTILGALCAVCGSRMGPGEVLRFDHEAAAFVHRDCAGTQQGDDDAARRQRDEPDDRPDRR